MTQTAGTAGNLSGNRVLKELAEFQPHLLFLVCVVRFSFLSVRLGMSVSIGTCVRLLISASSILTVWNLTALLSIARQLVTDKWSQFVFI